MTASRRLRFSGEIMEDIILPMQARAAVGPGALLLPTQSPTSNMSNFDRAVAAAIAENHAADAVSPNGSFSTLGGSSLDGGEVAQQTGAAPAPAPALAVSPVDSTARPAWEENPKNEFEKSRPPSRRLSFRRVDLGDGSGGVGGGGGGGEDDDDLTAGDEDERGDYVGPAAHPSLRTRGTQRAARRMALLKRERELNANSRRGSSSSIHAVAV